MENSSIPPELSFIFELAIPPTMEEELEMEKAIRHALTIKNVDELHRHLEAVLRQNHHQSIFISRSLDQIHRLTAKIACIENKVVQPKAPWWGELFNWGR